MFVMEDVYTVDDYLKHKIHGSDVIMEGNRKLRIGSIKTDQAKMEAWENSLKVSVALEPQPDEEGEGDIAYGPQLVKRILQKIK